MSIILIIDLVLIVACWAFMLWIATTTETSTEQGIVPVRFLYFDVKFDNGLCL